MSWIVIALLGYLCSALAAILDKYILSGPIKTPSVYAFFVSVFGLFTILFVPFDLRFFGLYVTGIFLLAGIFFLYGLLAFYMAVQENEISRISPLVGMVISLVTFGVAMIIPETFVETSFSFQHILALFLLIGGGLLISFDLPLRKGEHISRFVFFAGALMAFYLLLLKYGYKEGSFVNGLVWSHIGMFLGGLSLLLFPQWRTQILGGTKDQTVASKKNAYAGLAFVVNKILAGLATFLISYSAFLGSVSFVQALSGMQYVFLLIIALPLSVRFPHIFGEKLSFWDWFQKFCAIILIGIGLWLASVNGVTFSAL